MIFSVITEASAEQDWSEAVEWYEHEQAGVGSRLNSDIRLLVTKLARDPERFPLIGRLTRKAKLPRWPYSIYFVVNRKHREIKILAIWHGSRDPVELRRRLT